MNEHELKHGGIRSRRDSRDYKWEKVGYASTPFNWEVGYDVDIPLKVKDQGNSLSCGGQAMAYYGTVLNAKFDGSPEERSAKFIYAPIHYPTGGTTGRDLMDFVIKNGWGYESLTPSYEAGNAPSEEFMCKVEDITTHAKDEALHDRALSYVRLEYTDEIDILAQAIRDNKGALIGLIGQNNGTWRSMFPAVPTKGEWNHWVFAKGAKLINGKKYIVIKNSWGNIGDNGDQYINEDYFVSGNCFEIWTVVYNTQADPHFKHKFEIDLQRGMMDTEVTALQKALRCEGLFNYPVNTNSYGAVTQKAVYDFQIRYNISPLTRWIWRGFYMGPSTRKVLNQLYSP